MKANRRLLTRSAPWVAGICLLLFAPLLLTELLVALFGTPGGFVYFGHGPQYVYPVGIYSGSGYAIREVGGSYFCILPVEDLTWMGTCVLLAYAVAAALVAIDGFTVPSRIAVSPEQRWLDRLGSGACPDCGYDIRATPDAAGPMLDRCPECGCALEDVAETKRQAVARLWSDAGLKPPPPPPSSASINPRRTWANFLVRHLL